MSAPDKVITHGTGPVLHDWRFRRSVNGPDEVTFTAQNCSAMDTYSPGDAVVGYEQMHIVETDPRLVPGSQWDIAIRARGLISGTSRVIVRRMTTDTHGWDVLTERRMELVSATVPQFGQPHPSNGAMYFMAGGMEESLDLGGGNSYWCQRDRTYRGLASGSYKRISRKITTNGSVSSSESIIVNLPGGWTTAHAGNVSFPRVVVEDTIITTTAPPTASLPGAYTPPNPPPVTVLSISDNVAKYNWPSGWTLSGINSEELFLGAGLYRQTITYEYVMFRTL